MNWQIHAVSQAPGTTNINESLYIKLGFSPEIPFHFVLFIDNAAKFADLVLGKILNPDVGINASSS